MISYLQDSQRNACISVQLEAVLGRILRLKLEDPEAKILLFSEWNGVLDVVEHALRTNHINYARVKAGGCVLVPCIRISNVVN